MKDLLTLVQEYAVASANAERHHAIADLATDERQNAAAVKAAEWEGVAVNRYGHILAVLDTRNRATLHAVPDERLPVCTWQKGTVEARGILTDPTRSVRLRYSPAQALAAGSALIACAALADHHTGGTLTPILPPFPTTTPTPATTPEANQP
ncbi:hypothetical protein [Micromonospora zamorensis]|uniref:hypothetical protein n=1 Tax=Micromonospora zamorensis TaxID=709883 RepID=UPI0033BBD0B2